MADFEERNESGASLIVIGLALWVADMLVIFFAPGAHTPRQQAGFQMIMASLFLIGVLFILRGYKMRKQARKLMMEK